LIHLLLAAAVLPSLLDAVVRGLLAVLAREDQAQSGSRPGSWLVLIPARDEGAALVPAVASVDRARGSARVRTIVLLDGEDGTAVRALAGSSAEIIVKQPAGPSKAAALAWFTRDHPADLEQSDAVLILDAGSALAPDFFECFRWPPGAAAAQALLRGVGSGPGAGAAASERLAQHGEDMGRERLGWSVRLRGTGSVFRPDALASVAPRLVTQAEDEEATLLLAAEGRRIALAREAFAFDVKPALAADAARQRARWLAGRLEIALRQPGALFRLIGRRPAEGLAFALGLAGRPLSLTAPLRLLGGGVLLAISIAPLRWWSLLLGGLAVLTALADAAQMLRAGAGAGGMVRLGAAWVGAVALAPRAFARWMRGRRP
jgi:cellulose synthase/poly-beta-1,6-N-acetylglucosamine synthase-like glycosyltransferase